MLRLKIYSILFAAFVAFDASRFFLFHEAGLISWYSYIHAGWVTFGAVFLLATAFSGLAYIRNIGLGIYLIIFILAALNQFFHFSSALNYYCMLFNLALFTVYYFAASS